MSEGRTQPAKVVLLSIDGLRPAIYREEVSRRFPHLNALDKSGASAAAVESVYPSTTYPAHATIVTGVPPRVHGIYSHLASLDPTERSRPWCWFAAGLRAPALWDVARASGRRAAALSWPVSAGAAIDFNIPEIWNPAAADPHRDFDTPARHSTSGLFAEVAGQLMPMLSSVSDGQGLGQPDPDQLRCEAALYLWNRYRPDLLMVHFVWYDSQAHAFGPASPEALAALFELGRPDEVKKVARRFPSIRQRRLWCSPIMDLYRSRKKPRRWWHSPSMVSSRAVPMGRWYCDASAR